jgi:hypothetical protein
MTRKKKEEFVKKNKKLLILGFLLAFASFDSITAQADQSYMGAQGQFVMISGQFITIVPLFGSGHEFDDEEDYLRDKLNESASQACSGRRFSIDESSIHDTTSVGPARGGHKYTITRTAKAFCIN